MISNDKYLYDIDFDYFNTLNSDYKYEYLDSLIALDGRLQNRLLGSSKFTLGDILFSIYNMSYDENELNFYLHKFAVKLSLLEKYITKHFSEDNLNGNFEKLNFYDDKIRILEKQIIDILPEQYPIDTEDDELIDRYFEEYLLNENN